MGKPHTSMGQSKTRDQMKADNIAFADEATELTHTWVAGVKDKSIKHYGGDRQARDYMLGWIAVTLKLDISWVINRYLEVEAKQKMDKKARAKPKLHTVAKDNKKEVQSDDVKPRDNSQEKD